MFFGQRSSRDWALRALATLGIAMLGWSAVNGSLARVIVKSDPERAYAMAPDDGHIVGSWAEARVSGAGQGSDTAESSALAREALRLDATAVEAANALAILAEIEGQSDLADRAILYSQELSRRELRPQLIAIERAVAAYDVDAALNQYDLALRTSRDAPALLFPILTRALDHASVRSRLLGMMEKPARWHKDFFGAAATNGIAPEPTLAFFEEASREEVPVGRANNLALVNALGAAGLYELAWSHYSKLNPEADRRHSRDPDFAVREELRTLFDWQLGTNPAITSTIADSGDGSVLSFFVPPSVAGLAARQTLYLLPGRYRLEGAMRFQSVLPESRPTWSVACSDGSILGAFPVTTREDAEVDFGGRFTVTSGCEVQNLELAVRLTNGLDGTTGDIIRAEVSPAEDADARGR